MSADALPDTSVPHDTREPPPSGTAIEASKDGHSASAQKRSAGDFLSQEGEQETSHGIFASALSEPARKRSRLDIDGSEPSQSADEGEIIEISSGHESELPTGTSQPAISSMGWNHGVSSGVRTSFTARKASKGKKKPTTQVPEEKPQKVPPRGQEAANSPAHPQQQPGTTGQTNVAQASSDAMPNIVKEKVQNLTNFEASGIVWMLPDLGDPENRKGQTWQEKFEGWCRVFYAINLTELDKATEHIVHDAYQYYIGQASSLNPKRRKAALVGSSTYVAKGKLTVLMVNAREIGAEQKEQLDLDLQGPTASEWAMLLDKPAQPSEPGEEKPPVVAAEDVPTKDSNREKSYSPPSASSPSSDESPGQQTAYFPGVRADSHFCARCANRGHSSEECSLKSCVFCGDSEHSLYSCPSRSRCQKCRQLGHSKSSCKEKLALATGEGQECAICQASDHTETICSQLWTNFRAPGDEFLRKVKVIPTFCYSCGAEGHFGTECGLQTARAVGSTDTTWNKANRDRYVDPLSTELAVSLASAQPAGAGSDSAAPELRIRGLGRVGRQHHIVFESNDEDDVDFLRPPVQRAPAPGHIRTNINLGGRANGPYSSPLVSANGQSFGTGGRGQPDSRGGRNRRGNRKKTQQGPNPPLPPGPPPSLPPIPPQPNARRPGPDNQQGRRQGPQLQNNNQGNPGAGQGRGGAPSKRGRRGGGPGRGGNQSGGRARP